MGNDGWYGPSSEFDVITPTAKPARAAGPAFPWQGAVGGVNTGNGNKMTVLPITGWTMRGGMAVSCALIHNSQSLVSTPFGMPFGNKWLASYQSWLSKDGAGNVTVQWDNGQSYSFNPKGLYYNPPLGTNQTLTYNGSDNSYDITTQGKTKFHFNSLSGLWFLSSISDINGNTLTITRTPGGLVSTVADQASPPRVLTYGYDGTGRLASVTDPLGRTWGFTYGAAGGTGTNNLWYVTLPALNGQSYSAWFGYDGNNNIAAMQSPGGHANGYTSTFGYNGDCSLAWAKDPVGNTTTFSYTASTTTITDANNHATTHTYVTGLLGSVMDALGKAENYGYDWDRAQNYKQDRRGNPWKSGYTYQAHTHNITGSTSTDPPNYKSFSTSDTYGKPLTQTDALGNVTKITYDSQENPTETDMTGTDGVVRKSYISGYTNGLPSTVTDALNHSSSILYDAYGGVTQATDPSGHAAYSFSNALGWPTATADGLGDITATVRDAWGRVLTTVYPDSAAQPLFRLTYPQNHTFLSPTLADLQGAVSAGGAAVGVVGLVYPSASGASGLVPLYRLYNSASDHLCTASQGEYNSALANGWTSEGVIGYVFPGSGTGRQPVYRAYDTDAAQHIYTQDAAEYAAWPSGWVKEGAVFYALAPAASDSAASVAYDLDGDVLSATDADGHTVTNIYDGDDRLTQTTNGRGDTVTYAYDGPGGWGSTDSNGQTQFGLLSSKTDGNGHTTTYTYTARNAPYQTFYPDGTSESIGTSATNGYDAGGNVLLRVKPDGSSIAYAYDADGRLTDITYPHLHPVHFGYDALGRRTLMTDGLGTTAWTYGDGLHLTQTVTPYGTVAAPSAYTQTVGYAYDADGRRTIRTLVGLGSWTYGYFANGQPQTVQTPYGEATSFTYDGAGRLVRQVNGDSTIRTLGYDAAGQTTDLYDYTSVSQMAHFHYDYTPGGEVSRMTQNGAQTTDYTYDGADQLIGEVHAGDSAAYSLGFTYDHNGNRLTQTRGGSVVQSFAYDAHDKLLSGNASGETYSYDANGNQTGLNYYGSFYTFTWDDEDRLTGVTGSNGLNDAFLYNGLGQRTAKTDSTGQYALVSDGASPAAPVLADGLTVYTPGLSSRKNGYSEFRHGDLLGSLRFLTDANQTVVGDRLFSAFGATVASDGDPSTPFGWVGDGASQTDADTGLVLMGHRVYDSRLGRFLSPDPAGDGDNWYAYCGNDPVNGADPAGLKEVTIGAGSEDDQSAAISQDIPSSVDDWTKQPNGTYYTGSTVLRISGGSSYDDAGPSVWQDAGAGLSVGLSAVGSAASFHMWDGGAARHDPSFGVSRGLADVGVAAGTSAFGGAAFGGAAGTLGSVERSGQTLVTHWDTEEGLADIAKNGLKEGAWLMKGKPSIYNWIRTGKFLNYKYGNRVSGWLPDNTVTQQQVDIVQKMLGHYRYWPGVF